MSILADFQRYGRDLFMRGLTSSHGGNLSVRQGDRIFITRRGSSLANIREGDVIEIGMESDDSNIMLASSELLVHRAIYQNTSALAIAHVHPPIAVALSLVEDEIIPIDNEGSYTLHKVPVIQAELTTGSKQVAALASQTLREYKVVFLRGHGVFSTGQMLEEAYQWCSALEEACKIIYYTRMFEMHKATCPADGVHEYRKHSDEYKKW